MDTDKTTCSKVPSSQLNIPPEMETAESLERVRRGYSSVWMKQRLIVIAIWGGVAAVAALLGILLVKPEARPNRDLVDSISNAWFDGRTALGMLLFLALFVVGLVITISQIRKLFLGPPKAGSTAERTIRQFYEAVLLPVGQFNPRMELAAFLCLLNRAQQELGQWKGFCEYWKDVNKEIVKELKQQASQEAGSERSVDSTSIDVERSTILNETETYAPYVVGVTFSVNAKSVKDGNVDPDERAVKMGPYRYRVHGEAFRIGDRWYLGSGRWNAQLEAGVEAGGSQGTP